MKIAAYNVSTVDGFTTKYKTPSLAFRKGGVTYYIPLISPNSHYDIPGTNIRLVHNGEKAIRVRYNGSTYVVPTSKTSIITYDIPAGTYTPPAFKSLIDKYISVGGSRIVSNSFTVLVNGQPLTVNANAPIFSISNSSSGSRILTFGVNFSGSYKWAGEAFDIKTARSFTDNGVYITQSTGIGYFNKYMNYNITVTTGIKFK